MGKGLLSGLFWGGAVSMVLLILASLYFPLRDLSARGGGDRDSIERPLLADPPPPPPGASVSTDPPEATTLEPVPSGDPIARAPQPNDPLPPQQTAPLAPPVPQGEVTPPTAPVSPTGPGPDVVVAEPEEPRQTSSPREETAPVIVAQPQVSEVDPAPALPGLVAPDAARDLPPGDLASVVPRVDAVPDLDEAAPRLSRPVVIRQPVTSGGQFAPAAVPEITAAPVPLPGPIDRVPTAPDALAAPMPVDLPEEATTPALLRAPGRPDATGVVDAAGRANPPRLALAPVALPLPPVTARPVIADPVPPVPQPESAPAMATDPLPPEPQPEPAPAVAPEPEPGPEIAQPLLPAPAPVPAPASPVVTPQPDTRVAQAPTLPRRLVVGGGQSFGAGPGVSRRLPRIGGDVPADPAALAVEPEDERAAPPVGALARNASPFENADDAPELAFVLQATADRQAITDILARVPVPVAVALDPTWAGAPDRATELRAAGHEVLITLTGLPPEPQPQDIDVALAIHIQRLPMAVAVWLPEESPISGDRLLLRHLTGVLSDTGHGLVAPLIGLDAAGQEARAAGLSAASVAQTLLADTRQEALRALDRGALRAGVEGQALLYGETRADTLIALRDWAAAQNGQAGPRVAPISAILLGDGTR